MCIRDRNCDSNTVRCITCSRTVIRRLIYLDDKIVQASACICSSQKSTRLWALQTVLDCRREYYRHRSASQRSTVARLATVSHIHTHQLQSYRTSVRQALIFRLGFKTCISKTKTKTKTCLSKTKTQQFQDQDQDFDLQDQDRDSRLTRPILEVHDWDELWQTKSHGKQKIHHTCLLYTSDAADE